MLRRIFDYPDKRLELADGWIRVRDEGDKITLSYKQLNDRTLQGTKEINVAIDDFDAACAFLTAIGLSQISIQQTKRESWNLSDTQIEIDTLPWIPSFVEIVAKSEPDLFATAKNLALYDSVEIAYQAVYDISEADVDS
jgi:adenylate cyclase class 2